jgi:hypothetical protein
MTTAVSIFNSCIPDGWEPDEGANRPALRVPEPGEYVLGVNYQAQRLTNGAAIVRLVLRRKPVRMRRWILTSVGSPRQIKRGEWYVGVVGKPVCNTTADVTPLRYQPLAMVEVEA